MSVLSSAAVWLSGNGVASRRRSYSTLSRVSTDAGDRSRVYHLAI